MGAELDNRFNEADLWRDEALALREILLGCDLTEERKWGKPCYRHGDDNVCIIQRMKPHLALMFFKGALMEDPDGVLRSQGENTRSALRVEFTSMDDVTGRADTVRALVAEAIRVEKAGLKVEAPEEPDYPDELVEALEADDELREAFEGLTPGRRRYYLIHFSEPKKSETRSNRIAKSRDRILAGKGFNER